MGPFGTNVSKLAQSRALELQDKIVDGRIGAIGELGAVFPEDGAVVTEAVVVVVVVVVAGAAVVVAIAVDVVFEYKNNKLITQIDIK